MTHAKDIVVIGGGVIGLAAAYYAQQEGHRVTVVERRAPDGENCSRHNAGMVVPSHFIPLAAPGAVGLALRWMWNPRSPLYIKPRFDPELLSWGLRFMRASTAAHVARAAPLLRDLSLASRSLFDELATLADADFQLAPNGLLMLCRTGHALEEEAGTARRANELGIPAQVLSAQETARLDPNVRMNIEGAVYFPRDCHLIPDRFLRLLRDAVTRGGGRILWNTEVLRWNTHGRRVRGVATPAGDITGDAFVLAGGAWSPSLTRSLGLRLPMQAGKGYTLTLAQPRQLPRVCAIFTEARVAVTPMGSSLRFGGTMEIAGVNEDINPVRIQGIVQSVPRYYPDFKARDFDGITPWRGLRPVSPDGLPYLGWSRAHDNLVVATGHAMMGLSLAPISGKLVADLLSGRKPAIDLSLLAPDRFG